MKNIYFILFLTSFSALKAQNVDLANGLFGNEWIDYSKEYLKIKLATDDVYKLTYQELLDAGVPINTISANSLRLQNLGQDIAIYTSTSSQMTESDYLLFYGKKNRAELDKYLFKNPELDNVNDRYSMISDTSAYFLSWGHTSNPTKLQEITIDYTQTFPETRVYRHVEEKVYNSLPYKPVENADNVRYSSFVRGECFGSGLTASLSEVFNVVDRVNIGINPTISYRFGTNRNELNTKVTINNNLYKSYYNRAYNNYLINQDSTIDFSQISDNFTLNFSTSADSKITMGNLSISYTRTVDAAKGMPELMHIPAATTNQFLKIKNYSGAALKVINLTTGEVYNTSIQNNNLVVFIPSSTIEQQLAFVNDSNEQPILKRLQFFDFSTLDHDFVFLTSKKLNNNDDGQGNPIEDYIAYRRTSDGGNYNPVAVNIEDLYDQFSYGIDRHFLAIRHFAFYINANWTDVKFMFIVGKGREYANQRKDFQLIDPLTPEMLIPTYGQPGADNLLTRGIETPKLIFPTSRFAAINKQQVYDYLDKVIAHGASKYNSQTIEDRLWMKNVIHLSGGDTKIQESIRTQLMDMEKVIESSKMGAEVTTFAKFSSSPIEIAISEDLRDRLRSGASITTFFGHSATGNLDFSLGDIKTLDNKNKYPLMIALGCNAGNIHGGSTSGVSENYVNIKDRGMIAFIASVGSAYAYQQYLYGQKLYDVLGNADYGKPIGVSINAIIDSLKQDNSLGVQTFLEQVTLHGDPAISLQSSPSVDLIPNGKVAYTLPTNVNSYDPNFTFCFDLVNIGHANNDSVDINIQHLFPDGSISTDTTYRTMVPSYSNLQCIELPITDNSATGQHTLKVFVDNKNVIAELPSPDAENNNKLVINGVEGFNFYMLNNAAMPIYPTNFGITNKVRPTLLASTFNAFEKPQDFIIEFDTSGYFNSPSLIRDKVSDQVALVEWTVPYDLLSEKVYYWRISPDTINSTNGPVWNESSFMYHKDIEGGWNQSHYHQFLKDDFENININPTSREMEFNRNFLDINIQNVNYVNEIDKPKFYVDNNPYYHQFNPNAKIGVSVTIIDTTGNFELTPYPAQYGSYNPLSRPISTYLFRNLDKIENRMNLVSFLEDVVEDGKTVILNSIVQQNQLAFLTEEWDNDTLVYNNSIFKALEKQGASLISTTKHTGMLPYVIIYKKNEGLIDEKIAVDINGEANSVIQIPGYWFEGNVISTAVGPAKSWSSFSWDRVQTTNDTTFLKIYGQDIAGTKQVLIDNITSSSVDLSNIDANIFPYLYFEYYSKDKVDFSPSNILNWRTVYSSLPDIAIKKDKEYLLYSDSLQQGDNFKFNLPIVNNYSEDLGQIKATISIRNQNNEEEKITKEISKIEANKIEYITFEKGTSQMDGDYVIDINVNSDQNPREIYYFNNYGNIRVHVYKEKINPILDVTFDGVHILDNDLVSPSPMILINLKDENPYLLLNDTSIYSLSLEYPNGKVEQVMMDDARLLFIPATSSENNNAKLEFKPTFSEEGNYKLIVQSKDITGNISGATSYEVGFQVILKEQISEVYNYPNPFSTSTEFIFTLTGSQVPEKFTLQIMTISGKVVKEITKEEFGPIRIGLNRSQYKWDGRDEYGSSLGNGVYIYRVNTNKSDGTAFDKYELENTSQFFKDGWGKMVILR